MKIAAKHMPTRLVHIILHNYFDRSKMSGYSMQMCISSVSLSSQGKAFVVYHND